MTNDFQSYDFPKQRIPNSEKTLTWAAECCDWIIAQGIGMKDVAGLELKYGLIQGIVPDEAYKKILNPYNATNEQYTRFPATMRHYDMLNGILRRYIGEYIKSNHDFIVAANNPEVVFAKNAKLKQEIGVIIQQKIAVKIQESYTQWQQGGNDPKEFNPQTALDIPKFIEEFEEKYIDDMSEQGQHILNVIRDITEDTLLYARCYFDFISFGECFSYADITGNELVKKAISAKDAFPISTDNMFHEDDDAFACRRKVTFQQIMDKYGDTIDDNQLSFLNTYYARNGAPVTAEYAFSTYESFFPDVCNKYSKTDRDIFKKEAVFQRSKNSGLYDEWHVVWRGEARQALVTYQNPAGFIDTRVEADDYILNPAIGDISIEYVYQPQVYECIRIGGRNDAIYPLTDKGFRAIAFNRNGKLPYNGVSELLQGLGKFSIVEIVTPYSIFYDIVAYHREMALAKNKLSILMIAKSLLGKVAEETLYKMIADGVLYYDDTDDSAGLRAQQVRMLQASNNDYITQLGQMLMEIEQAAKNQVDMTPQRYGEIGNSAGKGTTDEAITRGSMGTVLIEFVMDCMRERDYARDMDYSKLAWIDGLDTSYYDDGHNVRYISLDVDKHNYASYLIKAKNAVKEKEKLAQLKQIAFSAAQNGDMEMAVSAIEGDNVATISNLIKKHKEAQQAYETSLKQIEQQTAQMAQEFELKKIAAKGEEDRKTEQLRGYIESEIQLIKADANMVSFDNGVSEADKQAGMQRLEASRNAVDREKLQFEKQKTALDGFNKFEDRKVKREDIAAKVEIAKTNRNKFDLKRPKKSK